jgi:hypothetical protein
LNSTFFVPSPDGFLTELMAKVTQIAWSSYL